MPLLVPEIKMTSLSTDVLLSEHFRDVRRQRPDAAERAVLLRHRPFIRQRQRGVELFFDLLFGENDEGDESKRLQRAGGAVEASVRRFFRNSAFLANLLVDFVDGAKQRLQDAGLEVRWIGAAHGL